MFTVLMVHARTDVEMSQAIFNGMRVKDAIDCVNRIREAKKLHETSRNSLVLERIFTHVSHLTKARNDILHHGAWADEGDSTSARVSNWRVAYNERKLQEFPISASILDDMTADVILIEQQLLNLVEHIARKKFVAFDESHEFWHRPWRYTQQQLKTECRMNRDKTRKQPRQPKASRKK